MNIFKYTPIDIVTNILSYDNRFVIRNGNLVSRLDKIKYKDIIHLLENKPIIKYKFRYNPIVFLPGRIYYRLTYIIDLHKYEFTRFNHCDICCNIM
jgi:hypothetical protein